MHYSNQLDYSHRNKIVCLGDKSNKSISYHFEKSFKNLLKDIKET